MKIRRPKVAAACHECRARKVKCDGKTPVCEPCRTRGASESCRWDPDPAVSKRKSNTARVSYLEKRLKDLESLYSTHQQAGLNRDMLFPDSNPVTDEPNNSEQRNIETSTLPTHTQQRLSYSRPNDNPSACRNSEEQFSGTTETDLDLGSGIQSNGALNPTTFEDDAPPDLVHPMIGPSEEEERQSQEFFGKSSAGTFMRNVKRLVEKRLGYTVTSANQVTRSLSVSLGESRVPHRGYLSHTDYVLPPRKVADKMMTFYWEYLHPTMPYLDPTQMQEEYESLWHGRSKVQQERSFHCLLNVMFALSSQLNEFMDIKERFRTAIVFYQRARNLLDVLDRGLLRAVQYCLLLGEYFQGTTDPHSAWMYVGLAIRTAQSLGLHRPETSQRTNDMCQKDLLRRLWHGCILMDRSLSVSYGRPCMIGPKSALVVPLPNTLDEQHNTLHGRVLNTDASRSALSSDFYICCLKLYEILHDVAFNFYSINSRGEVINLDNPRWAVRKSEANSCSAGHIISTLDQATASYIAITSVDEA